MNRSKLAYALLSSLVIALSLENAVGGGHSYEKGDKVDLWMNKVRLRTEPTSKHKWSMHELWFDMYRYHCYK